MNTFTTSAVAAVPARGATYTCTATGKRVVILTSSVFQVNVRALDTVYVEEHTIDAERFARDYVFQDSPAVYDISEETASMFMKDQAN